MLPAGCSRVHESVGVLSPDGRRFAFAREAFETVRKARVSYLATCLVDVATKKETTLPARGGPLAWASPTALVLNDGHVVDPVRGARVPKTASLTADVERVAVEWTRDATRVAYVPRTHPRSATTSIALVDADGKTTPVASTAGIRTDQAVLLAWSPDGARLYVNALFERQGAVPRRRALVLDVAAGTTSTLAEMPDWIDLPGLHDDPPRWRDPRVEGETKRRLTWEPPTGPRSESDVWDASGRLVTWLEGKGWTETDAVVADVTTAESWRVTVDGYPKWSPALDPAGWRLAFFVADDWTPETRTRRDGKRLGAKAKNRRIRVLDLATGEPTDLPIAGTDGTPGSLAWTTDGARLRYVLEDGTTPGAFLQDVGPAKAPPPNATIHRLELRRFERVIGWLAGYDEDRAHAAIHRAEDEWDPAYESPLRDALSHWTATDANLLGCLAHLVEVRQVRSAIPELRVALGRTPTARRAAARALGRLGDVESLPAIAKARDAAKDLESVMTFTGAMAALGDEGAWGNLEKAAKNASPEVRAPALRTLAVLRLPRAVDVLVEHVGDADMDDPRGFAKRFRASLPTIGEEVRSGLERISGKDLGADPATWRAWWTNEAKRTVPPERTGAPP